MIFFALLQYLPDNREGTLSPDARLDSQIVLVFLIEYILIKFAYKDIVSV